MRRVEVEVTISAGSERIIGYAALLLALLVRIPTLDQELREAHAFRQTQTAYTAVLFHEQGIDLIHPPLPLLGRPFEIPFEFPLFQAIASVPMAWGVEPTVALRATSLLFFLMTGALLWGLVRHVRGTVAGLAALVFFLFLPHGLLWGRAALIEYLPTAAGVAFLWCGILWRERRRPGWAVLAGLAFVASVLVKITSGVFWMLPLAAYRIPDEQAGVRAWVAARLDPVLAAVIGVPLLLAMAWTRHADAVKAAHEATAWLTSAALTDFTFGPLRERFVLANWQTITDRVRHLVTGLPLWQLGLILVAVARSSQRWFWVAVAAVGGLQIVVFFNLYVVHDYYLAAVTPAIAILLGVGLDAAWTWARTAHGRQAVVVVASVVWFGGLIIGAFGYWRAAYSERTIGELPLVAELVRFTEPDDLVIVEGFDWDPQLLYFSRRKGQMLPPAIAKPSFLNRLPTQGYDYLLTSGVTSNTSEMLVQRPWTGILGYHFIAMADTETSRQLHDAAVVATDDAAAIARTSTGSSVRSLVLTCDAPPVVVPRPSPEVWLRIAPADVGSTITTIENLPSLPPRRYIRIKHEAGAGTAPLQLACTGTQSLDIEILRPPTS